MTCAEDGTVLRSEPIEIQQATGIIKDLTLVQEYKEHNSDGTTTYIYS
jgi:hypothetical protein